MEVVGAGRLEWETVEEEEEDGGYKSNRINLCALSARQAKLDSLIWDEWDRDVRTMVQTGAVAEGKAEAWSQLSNLIRTQVCFIEICLYVIS